jgi:hypothetical protein
MRVPRGAFTLCSAVVLVVALAACKAPSTSSPSAPAVRETDPATLGREAFDRRDWAAAAPLLRTAITRDAENVDLHYRLAITASYLSVMDEAGREFEWVLAHAREGSEEARTARQWLADAGAHGATPGRDDTTSDSRESASATRVGESGISGIIMWAEAGRSPEPKRRMQVNLAALPGQQTVTEQRFTVRTDQDGRYVFSKIPPGMYKVTNTVAGTPLWRLRVRIEPGRETTLDLDNGNSIGVRDDFPDPG